MVFSLAAFKSFPLPNLVGSISVSKMSMRLKDLCGNLTDVILLAKTDWKHNNTSNKIAMQFFKLLVLHLQDTVMSFSAEHHGILVLLSLANC